MPKQLGFLLQMGGTGGIPASSHEQSSLCYRMLVSKAARSNTEQHRRVRYVCMFVCARVLVCKYILHFKILSLALKEACALASKQLCSKTRCGCSVTGVLNEIACIWIQIPSEIPCLTRMQRPLGE